MKTSTFVIGLVLIAAVGAGAYYYFYVRLPNIDITADDKLTRKIIVTKV